ncbi:hypothetical protein [Amycolatopsis pithecellobii]|uniref:Uncharacterized protein n=1 Tax=Amycolatopsis pithecellobii TaxID=664692 RepID=A0A6N7YNI8_9PSEU|nr:hypothetical protein [Amycolatopsis pithecellobii]MTD53438.1 hypothetical protein [Amycolatopsis pithecellobii]
MTLFKILVLREQPDGATGADAESMARQDPAAGFWENRRAEIERIARAADKGEGA